MKKLLLAAACLVSLAVCQVANAVTITSSIGVGYPSGSYETFDSLIMPGNSGSQSISFGTITLTPDAQVVTGTQPTYAAPWVGTGPDQSHYITTGKSGYQQLPTPGGRVVIDFNENQGALGLLWGSVDTYNTIEFFNGTTLVATVTGTDIYNSNNSIIVNGIISGSNQGEFGTAYVNITDIPSFNKAVFTSGNYAFEFDNVRVPDGGATLAMLGFGVMGLAGLRRKMA